MFCIRIALSKILGTIDEVENGYVGSLKVFWSGIALEDICMMARHYE